MVVFNSSDQQGKIWLLLQCSQSKQPHNKHLLQILAVNLLVQSYKHYSVKILTLQIYSYSLYVTRFVKTYISYVHNSKEWFSLSIDSSINKLITTEPLPNVDCSSLCEACQTSISVQELIECHWLVCIDNHLAI